uniref:Uncharacterized protein n=1 Tax=Anguilla anguilla TaxID=7936 RepID=A0A0E9TJG8_ANGAN
MHSLKKKGLCVLVEILAHADLFCVILKGDNLTNTPPKVGYKLFVILDREEQDQHALY